MTYKAVSFFSFKLMKENGGDKTQLIGEKAIEYKVWRQISTMVTAYPFNTETVSDFDFLLAQSVIKIKPIF